MKKTIHTTDRTGQDKADFRLLRHLGTHVVRFDFPIRLNGCILIVLLYLCCKCMRLHHWFCMLSYYDLSLPTRRGRANTIASRPIPSGNVINTHALLYLLAGY